MRAESGTAVVESTLLLSVGLSLLNSIPLFPFDGGRVTEAAIDAGLGGGAARWFRVGTGVVAVGLLLLYLIVAGVWWLIT
jgi:Zn-dependent protease